MIDACSRATILDELMQLRNEIGMTIISSPMILAGVLRL